MATTFTDLGRSHSRFDTAHGDVAINNVNTVTQHTERRRLGHRT